MNSIHTGLWLSLWGKLNLTVHKFNVQPIEQNEQFTCKYKSISEKYDHFHISPQNLIIIIIIMRVKLFQLQCAHYINCMINLRTTFIMNTADQKQRRRKISIYALIPQIWKAVNSLGWRVSALCWCTLAMIPWNWHLHHQGSFKERKFSKNTSHTCNDSPAREERHKHYYYYY